MKDIVYIIPKFCKVDTYDKMRNCLANMGIDYNDCDVDICCDAAVKDWRYVNKYLGIFDVDSKSLDTIIKKYQKNEFVEHLVIAMK